MTDQKIEEIRARHSIRRSISARDIKHSLPEVLLQDFDYLLTELDRLKAKEDALIAELTKAIAGTIQCSRCMGNGEIVTDWDRYLHAQDGDKGDEAVTECPSCDGTGFVTTLKASGTFSDGLEAALNEVEWHYHNVQTDAARELCGSIRQSIRALSPQPRPDAQAQREALAEFCYGKGYNDAQWHKDGKTATELVEAFEGSKA